MKLTPVVVVDSREQNPWSFANLPSEPGSLATGDYSVRGLEHLIAVERKPLGDLLACIGIHRGRFKRELQRLKAYRFRALIIEASYADLEAGRWRSQLKPSHAIGSLSAWMVQFELPIWLAGDHAAAARFAEKFLYQAARCVAAENKAIGCHEAVA